MLARHTLAVALVCAPLQPTAAQDGPCISEQGLLNGHREALIERLGPTDAQLFMAELAKVAGDPPQPIKPSAILVFRQSEGGIGAQFFDENGCAAFGANMSDAFYGAVRSKVGLRA